MEETPLSQIGKYKLTDLLGQGAMGVVYRALDPVLNRHVAIKLMSQGIAADAELRDRFMREAQSAGSLQHPNIITIFDFGEAEGHLFIAMEYIDGADLSEIIERRDALPLSAKLDIAIDVLHALHYAHSRRVVHRDIKPANIRVSADGRAKLMDFGIARLESSTMTKSGMLVGTPNYMAPEQVTSGQVSPATDIFSLGVVLYELLTYRKVFEGDTLHAVLYKIVSEDPPSLRDARDVPGPLRDIVEKALAKDPKARYQAAGDMAQAISVVRTGLSSGATVVIRSSKTSLTRRVDTAVGPQRRGLRTVGAAGVVLLLGALTWLAVSLRRATPAPTVTPSVVAQAPVAPGAVPSAAAPSPVAARAHAQAPSRSDAAARPTALGVAPGAPNPGLPTAQSAPAATASSGSPAPSPTAPPTQTPAQQSAPAPAAPQPAADPRADIEQLIAAYGRAIESRSVAEIRRVYPGLTGSQQQGWEQFFQSMRNVRARLAITRLDASGSSADLTVNGSYEYDAGGGRTEHQPVTFRATATVENGTWRLQTIR